MTYNELSGTSNHSIKTDSRGVDMYNFCGSVATVVRCTPLVDI